MQVTKGGDASGAAWSRSCPSRSLRVVDKVVRVQTVADGAVATADEPGVRDAGALAADARAPRLHVELAAITAVGADRVGLRAVALDLARQALVEAAVDRLDRLAGAVVVAKQVELHSREMV